MASYTKILARCDEIMLRDEIRWFDGTVLGSSLSQRFLIKGKQSQSEQKTFDNAPSLACERGEWRRELSLRGEGREVDGELLTGCSWVLMSVLNTAFS